MKSRSILIGRKMLCFGLTFALAILMPHTRLSDTPVVHAQETDMSATVSDLLFDGGRGAYYYHVDFLAPDGYGFGVNIYTHDYGDGRGLVTNDLSLTAIVLPPAFFYSPLADCLSDQSCAQCIEQDHQNCINTALAKAVADGGTVFLACMICIMNVEALPLAIACAIVCAVIEGGRMRQIRGEAETCMAGSAGRCSSQLGRPCH